MPENPRIEYVNYGIGNTFKDRIELNKALKKYPKLHDKVLQHELKHYNKEENVDLKEHQGWQMNKFIITHPSTWVQYLPVWYKNKIISYDPSMITIWILLLSLSIKLIIASIYPITALISIGQLCIEATLLIKWLKSQEKKAKPQ
jgi:hypothetical protein